MSILINGMDMPKHAVRKGTDDTVFRSCVLVHPNGTAELVVDLEFADQFNFDHNLKRFSLAEIPTPHGDLIDRDHLLDMLDKIILKPDSYGQRCMAMATKEILIWQTPVIKAEE